MAMYSSIIIGLSNSPGMVVLLYSEVIGGKSSASSSRNTTR